MAWTLTVDTSWPPPDAVTRLALDVDPRRRTLHLGPQVVGTGCLEIQSGAIARSFYACAEEDLAAASEWLAGDEAGALLDAIEAGFRCDLLWSGDPVVTWSDSAWEAGAALVAGVGARIGPD